ncbi:hypothetical protein HZ992_15305 [Rhizobacter sp. AJA081-3]|jgi:hypothetical protein|uniref:hypothetical protein n=1 Tax=Rhizobacter sp. AJA081-3 TaxID=2753607 RepID=UPI001ADECD3E|nr:hypothetical protein [Rhizobacter sp. AJA081-3]QTN21547.1 hypothetical protein HZ992_15305 [Rhizobacter sp. AJA081-3]
MNYLEPWYALAEDECADLSAELTRELPVGHELEGISVKCLARRQDRDDVLFELKDGSGRLAAVHLTWQVESKPPWPSAVIYSGPPEWLAAMKQHHSEYDA